MVVRGPYLRPLRTTYACSVPRLRALHVSATRREAPKAPNQFPASFVVATAMPEISKMTSQEAQHRRKILSLLNSMNLPQIQYAFAYGSGVFSQAPKSQQVGSTPPMIDMVVVVRDPVHWHAHNMLANPGHYPWWARLSPQWWIRRVQKMGAHLWYVPYVKANDEIIKYGVISTDDMCNDLLYWNTLYVGGRMHKPIARLFNGAGERVLVAEQANLTSALRASLLMLPEEFTETDLYLKIASLSYIGDFRMSVPGGENRNKVRNIVENQIPWFRIMYADLIARLRFIHVTTTGDNYHMKQNTSPTSRALVAARLPQNLRVRIAEHYLKNPSLHPVFEELKDVPAADLAPVPRETVQHLNDTDPKELLEREAEDTDSLPPRATRFWFTVVQQPTFQKVLHDKIAEIVEEPARVQSLKGLYTAGITRSLRYLWSKLKKYRQGRMQK